MEEGAGMKLSKELQRVEIPEHLALVAVNRVQPLIRMWPWEVNRTAVERLALSAYTQGLIDAYHIHTRKSRPHDRRL